MKLQLLLLLLANGGYNCSAFVVPKSGANFGVHHTQPVNLVKVKAEEAEDAVNVLVDVLDKRNQNGSLDGSDVSAAVSASDVLMEHLDDQIQNSVIQFSQQDIQDAVSQMDVDAVSTMLHNNNDNNNMIMNDETVEVAFWSVVKAVNDAEEQNLPLSANVTIMLHHIFDADLSLLQQREKQTTNVTCMQPDKSEGVTAAARAMNYVFDDSAHKDLPLMEGRQCEGGTCCDECSRNIFPTFALDHESSLETFPELASLTFNNLEKVSTATIIQFVRLVERVRRTIAFEYGLPLSSILPLQAYSRKYVAGSTQQGGGGGEGDFVTLHTDEATHDGYHYSCVLYMSTQGEDFEGGSFVFNDPAPKDETKGDDYDDDDFEVTDELLELLKRGELPDTPAFIDGPTFDDEGDGTSFEEEVRRAGRVLSPFHPTRGAGVIFSSGWENMHEVEKITSGIRYAVPCFFTTCPVPDAAYDQMKVGKPQSEDDISDDWLHLLLAHRKEEPIESVGRVKELLMKWHYMCTPLCEH